MSHGVVIDSVWNHWPSIIVTAAAIFSGLQALLTRQLVRLQQTPLVTLIADGTDDTAPCIVKNIGPTAAVNVFAFQAGHESPILKVFRGLRSIGDMAAGAERTLDPPITVKLIEEHPYWLYYRDAS